MSINDLTSNSRILCLPFYSNWLICSYEFVVSCVCEIMHLLGYSIYKYDHNLYMCVRDYAKIIIRSAQEIL